MKKNLIVCAAMAAVLALSIPAYAATPSITATPAAIPAITAAAATASKASITEISTSATASAAHIQFAAVANATGYELYIQNPANKKYEPVDASAQSKISETGEKYVSYNLSGLKADTAYNFKVRASGGINGVKAANDFSEVITVKTAKAVFDGAKAQNITGSFKQSHTGYTFTFAKDGTGTIKSDNTKVGGYQSQDFIYSAVSVGEVAKVTIIGGDFSFSASSNDDGTWDLFPETSGRSYTLTAVKK